MEEHELASFHDFGHFFWRGRKNCVFLAISVQAVIIHFFPNKSIGDCPLLISLITVE
jgi:hypothetical protein